jgi:trehalose 6-phosphate phosphatase
MPRPLLDPVVDALFLDLDGTMIDIAATPGEVHAPASLVTDLAALCSSLGGALAVVSGRSIETIDALLAPLRVPAAGVHGAELRFDADGVLSRRPAPLVPNGVRWLLAPLARLPGVLIEDKGTAIAVHYRQAPSFSQKVRYTVERAVRAHPGEGLTVIAGKCVFEIKNAGFSKGTALAAFMARAPWSGRRPVFVGDDVTDEAAFAELPQWGGLGMAVGKDRPGAAARFGTAADVRAWLAMLAQGGTVS